MEYASNIDVDVIAGRQPPASSCRVLLRLFTGPAAQKSVLGRSCKSVFTVQTFNEDSHRCSFASANIDGGHEELANVLGHHMLSK